MQRVKFFVIPARFYIGQSDHRAIISQRIFGTPLGSLLRLQVLLKPQSIFFLFFEDAWYFDFRRVMDKTNFQRNRP